MASDEIVSVAARLASKSSDGVNASSIFGSSRCCFLTGRYRSGAGSIDRRFDRENSTWRVRSLVLSGKSNTTEPHR
jgi:hypothetical protein